MAQSQRPRLDLPSSPANFAVQVVESCVQVSSQDEVEAGALGWFRVQRASPCLPPSPPPRSAYRPAKLEFDSVSSHLLRTAARIESRLYTPDNKRDSTE